MQRRSCSSSARSVCRRAILVIASYSCAGLAGCVAGERNAEHGTPITVVVVDRIVLRATIVPEGDRADLPVKPTGELRSRLLLEQIVEQRRAFRLGHILAADAMGD